MAIESACTPLPSEIIMCFSGYLVFTGRFNLVAVATAGAIGCNIGSSLAYALGAYGGRSMISRWGRYVLVGQGELEFVDRFFQRFGAVTVLVSRLMPLVRSYISFPAGVSRVPFLRFQIYTFLGSWPWCFALAYVGFKLGEQWHTNPSVQTFFHRFDWVIATVLALSLIAYVAHRVWHRGQTR